MECIGVGMEPDQMKMVGMDVSFLGTVADADICLFGAALYY